jgi:hypothetical protein
MYTLLHNKQWDNGKRYSIFGVPDIGDFSVAFGTWNPYDVAIKNVKQANDIKKAEKISRVEGMKEGALSAPIVYYERDVRSTEGNFIPKVQTKNITKVFKEVNVKKETKNQTINALTNRLKTVNDEYKSVMGTPTKLRGNVDPEVVVASALTDIGQRVPAELQFEPFDREKTKQLLKEKESLTTRLTTIRSTNPSSYNNVTNFSQLVKNPDTIMTLADDFTIFDSGAYYKAINTGENPIEKINDIRNKVHKIPSELLPHYKLTELMGPPELLPTGMDAYKRELSNPLQQKKKLQLTYNIDVLDIPHNQYTPKKSKFVDEKIQELTTPIKHSLNKGPNINTVKKIQIPQSPFIPLTQDEINAKINSFTVTINSSPTKFSPTKARLQQKLIKSKSKKEEDIDMSKLKKPLFNQTSSQPINKSNDQESSPKRQTSKKVRESKTAAMNKIDTHLHKSEVEETPKKRGRPKKK